MFCKLSALLKETVQKQLTFWMSFHNRPFLLDAHWLAKNAEQKYIKMASLKLSLQQPYMWKYLALSLFGAILL